MTTLVLRDMAEYTLLCSIYCKTEILLAQNIRFMLNFDKFHSMFKILEGTVEELIAKFFLNGLPTHISRSQSIVCIRHMLDVLLKIILNTVRILSLAALSIIKDEWNKDVDTNHWYHGMA